MIDLFNSIIHEGALKSSQTDQHSKTKHHNSDSANWLVLISEKGVSTVSYYKKTALISQSYHLKRRECVALQDRIERK